MKLLITLLVLLMLPVMTYEQAQPNQIIELTRDNPATLISTNSSNYSIFGLKLGMSPAEVQRVLSQHKMLVGARDQFNSSRIYVSDRGPGGRKGKEILYLIWEPGRSQLSEITIFVDCAGYLKPNFARLLTPEGISDSSVFKKTFIGNAERSNVTLDVKSIDLKNITYYYDQIGIEVTLVHSGKEEHVVFALVAKNPK
jgi:hypothetical protein